MIRNNVSINFNPRVEVNFSMDNILIEKVLTHHKSVNPWANVSAEKVFDSAIECVKFQTMYYMGRKTEFNDGEWVIGRTDGDVYARYHSDTNTLEIFRINEIFIF